MAQHHAGNDNRKVVRQKLAASDIPAQQILPHRIQAPHTNPNNDEDISDSDQIFFNLVRNPHSELHILVFVNGFHYIGDLFNLEKL